MTLGELNEHLDMLQSLNKANETLAALWDAADSANAQLTGMPHGTGVSDRVGYYATEIADLNGQVEYIKSQIAESEERISKWVMTIEDGTTRVAFRLHYLRGLQWKEVAPVVGKYCTESSVKNMCYRYLDQCGRDATSCDAT